VPRPRSCIVVKARREPSERGSDIALGSMGKPLLSAENMDQESLSSGVFLRLL
jgi:hypothetical protein